MSLNLKLRFVYYRGESESHVPSNLESLILKLNTEIDGFARESRVGNFCGKAGAFGIFGKPQQHAADDRIGFDVFVIDVDEDERLQIRRHAKAGVVFGEPLLDVGNHTDLRAQNPKNSTCSATSCGGSIRKSL